MPRNKIEDLNNLLFEQLERLIEAEDEEEVKREISRSKAVSSVASGITNIVSLSIQAKKIQLEYGEDTTYLQIGTKHE